MQEKINKIIWVVLIILIIFFIGLFFYNKINNKKQYVESKFFYMDTYIYVKIYGSDTKKINKKLKEVEKIYKEYHELTDRYNSYDNINNIYYIKNNDSKDEYIKLDKRLYNIIKYGKQWYKKSDGLLDISMGNVIDVWKKYRDDKSGIPTQDELEKAHTDNIEDIILTDDYKIKNNHINMDLGAIAKGYTTKIVGEYLKEKGLNKFLINAGGNVLVGDKYSTKNYSIGIENPNSTTKDIFTVVSGSNIAVVTSGGYERYYEYDGKKYHHIINPTTLFPSDYMKSVTIITSDSALGDILSTTLFLMDIEDGKKYVDSLENVEAIWYTNYNKQITSSGYSKYEYK